MKSVKHNQIAVHLPGCIIGSPWVRVSNESIWSFPAGPREPVSVARRHPHRLDSQGVRGAAPSGGPPWAPGNAGRTPRSDLAGNLRSTGNIAQIHSGVAQGFGRRPQDSALYRNPAETRLPVLAAPEEAVCPCGPWAVPRSGGARSGTGGARSDIYARLCKASAA